MEWPPVYHVKGWGKFNRYYGDFCTGADRQFVYVHATLNWATYSVPLGSGAFFAEFCLEPLRKRSQPLPKQGSVEAPQQVTAPLGIFKTSTPWAYSTEFKNTSSQRRWD